VVDSEQLFWLNVLQQEPNGPASPAPKVQNGAAALNGPNMPLIAFFEDLISFKSLSQCRVAGLAGEMFLHRDFRHLTYKIRDRFTSSSGRTE